MMSDAATAATPPKSIATGTGSFRSNARSDEPYAPIAKNPACANDNWPVRPQINSSPSVSTNMIATLLAIRSQYADWTTKGTRARTAVAVSSEIARPRGASTIVAAKPDSPLDLLGDSFTEDPLR